MRQSRSGMEPPSRVAPRRLRRGIVPRPRLSRALDRGREASLTSVAGELRSRDMDSAIFVSDPTHMLRVLRIADDLGIEAYGSPTTTSPVQQDPFRRAEATVHELGALAVYFLSGGAPQVEQSGG